MHSQHDHILKWLSREAYSPRGEYSTEEEVSPDAGRIDIRFSPGPDAEVALAPLGMLGRMGLVPCVLEGYHDTPGSLEVMGCLCKLYYYRRALLRRDKEAPLPIQWIVSSGRPSSALAELGFRRLPKWGPGDYQSLAAMFTRLVVVSELRETRDTLLLRLLGAGQVLHRAVVELLALPEGALERSLAKPILVMWSRELAADPSKLTPEEKVIAMLTRESFEQYTEEQRQIGRDQGVRQGLDQGLRQGLDQGIGLSILALFESRFGGPPGEVTAVVKGTHDQAQLLAWLKIVANGSAEEARTAILGQSAS